MYSQLLHQIGAGDGSELGANENGGAFLHACLLIAFELSTFKITTFSADQITGPGGERGEGDLVILMRLLDAGGLEIFQDHLHEVAFFVVFALAFANSIDQLVVFIHAQHAVRG